MSRPLHVGLLCIALTPALACGSTPVPAPGFRAGGNEPGWRLDIGAAEMVLVLDFGQTRVVAPKPEPQVADATTKYTARTGQGELTATIVDRLCVDSMSGMPHPKSVTVVLGDRTLTGCGGEPASLLQGAEWQVTKVGGLPLLDGSRVTVAFDAAGGVSGQASCNRYTGKYALTGEGLSISPAATTRMACDTARMEQERRFLAALGGVTSFSVAADGALLLRAGDGSHVEARRH